MRYIIIEDEPLATERVQAFAGRISYLEEAATFENAVSAMGYVREHPVDLIFLDINVGEVSGMQFLEIVQPECAVIVLTAYEQYALQGFEMKVTDYLLKPFTFERFSQATERARSQYVRIPEKQSLFVKTQHRLEKVLFNDLLYIEGAGDYRRIQTSNRSILTLETFGELEKKLPQKRFLRVHKSYLVAFDKVSSVEGNFIYVGTLRIPVSETYRMKFMERIRKG